MKKRICPQGIGSAARIRPTALFVLCVSLLCGVPLSAAQGETVLAQTQQSQPLKSITGVVTDDTGLPLSGATVVVAGTFRGTSSDLDGKYAIDAAQGQKLRISFLGFHDKEIVVGGQTRIDVNLQGEASALDEVVVIGYGTVKKRDLTGSLVSVKAADITLSPTSNPMEALQGKVAGMDITRTSGSAGSGVSINIRGNRSLSLEEGANDPMFIIDGMPGNYSTLNPQDIESIEVLKDASSTAIYGSAGANGVVIITTRKGGQGKPLLNFDAYVGFNGFQQYPKGRTAEDYTRLRSEAFRTVHGAYPDDLARIYTNTEELRAMQQNRWVDWEDLAMHNGLKQNYSVSLSGGGEYTRAYFSLNYNDEQGIFKNDNAKIYSVRANVDQTVFSWMKAGVNLQVSYHDVNARKGAVLSKALTAVPLGEPYDENGGLNLTPIAGSSAFGPLSDERDGATLNNTATTSIVANAYLEITPVKGLSIKSVIGANLSSSRNGRFNSAESLERESKGTSYAYVKNARSYGYKWENILNYTVTIARDHSLTLTGVTSWEHDQSEASEAYGENLTLDKYLFHNLSEAQVGKNISSNYVSTQGMSYIARINYSYRGKYLVTLSSRWDGSSRLSWGNKWDVFPAAALAWRLSDENWLKDVQTITNLKLRVGYGVTGNSHLGAYGTISGVQSSTLLSFGNSPASFYVYNAELANAALGWEKSYNTNIGIDLGLFNNRLDFTLELYNTDTKDILKQRTMPSHLGGSMGSPFVMWQNICQTNNKGYEIMINSRNFANRNFTWTTTLSFSQNREKITALPDGDLVTENLFIGHPVNTFYDYRVLGIWQMDEVAEAARYGLLPGDIKILDADKKAGENTYTGDDKVILGSGVPDWTGGLQNNFTFYNFDISILLYARWGQMIKSDIIGRYDPSGNTNSPAYFDYWTPENPTNDFPRPKQNASLSSYTGYEGLSYVEGSFVKIKNITLGYTLPPRALSAMHMRNFRMYATVANPFVFASSHLLKNYDPEQGGSDEFPLTKQIVFGINVSF